MLTPQEVSEKKFKQSFIGGYDMSGVDDFLESLTSDYSALFKENALLKSKIRVLVDKLEEYRKVDDSMRQALLGAQKMAEKIKSDASEQSQKVLGDLQKQLENRKKELKRELALEETRLETARSQTITFVNSLREIYARQSEQLAAIPGMMPPVSPRKEREVATAKAAMEITESVNAAIRDEMETHPAPPEPFQKPATPPPPPSVSSDTRVIPERETQPSPPNAAEETEAVQTFEIIFGDNDSMDDDALKSLWEPEHDTEIPRPKFDFSDLENQFGSDKTIVIDRKRR